MSQDYCTNRGALVQSKPKPYYGVPVSEAEQLSYHDVAVFEPYYGVPVREPEQLSYHDVAVFEPYYGVPVYEPEQLSYHNGSQDALS